MNDLPNVNLNNLQPITKICASIGIIPSSYLVAMSYEEQLLWLCDFINNTIILNINTNNQAVQELQNLYIELKNYVDNYFTNLDVQKEINNKLDEMAEDGSLLNLLTSLFNDYQEQITLLQNSLTSNYNTLNNKINVNQTNILNQLSSIESGTPAGTYEDLDALKLDVNADKTKIYLTLNDGKWNYYNNSTEEWTSGGVYFANTTIENITPNQLSFLEQKTLNIFDNDNLSSMTEGLLKGNGEIDTTKTDYYTSNFLSVTPNTKYYKPNLLQGAFYDINKSYISSTMYGNEEFTTPSNCFYFRISLLKTDLPSFYVSTVDRWSKFGFNPFYAKDSNLLDLISNTASQEQNIQINQTEFFRTNDTNIYSYKDIIEGYSMSSAGRLVESPNQFTTQPLLLPKGATGNLYVTESYQVIILDSSKNIIQSVGGINNEKNITLVEGACYVQVTFANIELYQALILLNETKENYLAKSKNYLLFRTTNQLNSIINQICSSSLFKGNILEITQGSQLFKKKWCAIGDSITEGYLAPNNYVKLLTDNLGLETTNLGNSGSGFKRKEDENKAYYQIVNNIPDDTEFVTIFASGNDLNDEEGRIVGEITDTGTNTLCGCINTTLNNLYTKFPGISVGIMSMMPWRYTQPGKNEKWLDYANKIKQICENNSIPFLNMYLESNLRPWDETFRTNYMTDGVHPNNAGTLLFVNKIKEFILSL